MATVGLQWGHLDPNAARLPAVLLSEFGVLFRLGEVNPVLADIALLAVVVMT